ncbi:hypothetical protein ACGFRG_05805 [Streptomyces sp. NPDC048696]|uniref:hypothetical protein n=1 Tax=Streptomyces sp. NPDC048696 TaxID=3365585 RepID=UPI0037163641
MNVGKHVNIRHGDGAPLRDRDGRAITFRISAVDDLGRAGTWYLLDAETPPLQELFGGWRPALDTIRT